MYYEARSRALTNGDTYHLAAYTRRGKIGVNNTGRNTAKFRKRYKNSRDFFHDVHAEIDLLNKSDVVPDRIYVVRFLKDGTPTMAKPCVHCQNFLRHAGVKVVRYTDWSGAWRELKL